MTRVATLSVRILEMWWVVRDPVARRFMQVIGWAPLSVPTCTLLPCISGIDWPILLKFNVWQEVNSYEAYKSRNWGDCTFARASPDSLSSRKPLSPVPEAAAYPRLQGYWGNQARTRGSWELGYKVPPTKNGKVCGFGSLFFGSGQTLCTK